MIDTAVLVTCLLPIELVIMLHVYDVLSTASESEFIIQKML